MKQAAFENLYSSTWQQLDRFITDVENKATPSAQELKKYNQLFRKVCHFHSLAIKRNYSSFLVDHLEDIVVRAHQQVYRRKKTFSHQFVQFIVSDFPALVREEKTFVAVAALLFIAPTLILFICGLIAPEFVYTIIDPAQAQNMEDMYNPENRILGSAREASTNWSMFGFYIKNNISVSFRTFSSGIMLGVGSGFFLVYNGALMGAVAAHLTTAGFTTTFFTFVVGHGSFELTAIVLSGAAGLKLGYSLLAPGQLSRTESLKRAAHIAIKIVYGVIVMLVIAAFIEAFWSSNNALMPCQKYSMGGLLWALVFAYFIWSGRSYSKTIKTLSTEKGLS